MGRGHGGSRGSGPSKSSSDRTMRGYSAGLAREMNFVENSIRNADVEHGIIMDTTGGIITHSIGEEHQVRIEGPWKDNIVTHNHPSGRSFSSVDIRSTVGSDAREMRISGRSGYNYSIKRPERGWGMSGNSAKAAYQREYDRVEKIYQKYFDLKARNSSWREGRERFKSIASHLVMRNLAKRYGWDYSKQKVN